MAFDTENAQAVGTPKSTLFKDKVRYDYFKVDDQHPKTFRILPAFPEHDGEITNQISLNSYMSNFLVIIFIMGVVFEIPLLAWVLSQLGLISRPFLREYRKHAVVVLLIMAAVITPSGDPFTLAVVFIPLFLLYELAILVVRPGSPESGEDPEPEVEDGF